MARAHKEHSGQDPWTYYDRNQEFYGPEYEGGYDPGRDRFVRSPEWEEGQFPEDQPHKTYFRSTFQVNPFGASEQTGPSGGWRRRGPYAGRGPKGYQKSDERVYDQVCELLTDHPMIDARDIEVQVREGIVTLSGTVNSRQTKRLSEDVASSVPGVHDVQNQLRVSPTHWAEGSGRG